MGADDDGGRLISAFESSSIGVGRPLETSNPPPQRRGERRGSQRNAALPDAATLIREGITLEDLHALARALTDVQAAEELNEARLALFRRVPARIG